MTRIRLSNLISARRHALQAFAAWAAVSLFAGASYAQAPYPNKPIRLVVPFVTGGVADVGARLVAEKLSKQLGQPIVVDNKAGATGNIGTQFVAQAEPDGYTLLLAFDGTLVINPNVYKKLPFDTVKDFAPIGKIGDAALVLVVNPKVPAQNLKELIALAKATPGGLSYGSSGTGSTPHLAGELLRQRTGMSMLHVPYKGGGQAMGDVVGGVLPMLYTAVASAVPFVKNQQVRPIAVSSAQRSPAMPDVPTFIESGVSDFKIASWIGISAPARTPRPIIDRLNTALNEVLNAPEMRERLATLGIVTTPGTPEAFGHEIADELQKYKAIVKTADIHID